MEGTFLHSPFFPLDAALDARSFAIVNHNFDDLSVNRGCRIDVSELGNGDMLEMKTVIATGQLIAERLTEFGESEIKTTVTHFPWQREENGNEILSKEHKIMRLTAFNPDGSITETIT